MDGEIDVLAELQSQSTRVRKAAMLAVVTLTIFAALGLSATVGTIVVTARDGYRRVPTRQA